MIDIKDIIVGKSYACKFKVETMLNKRGKYGRILGKIYVVIDNNSIKLIKPPTDFVLENELFYKKECKCRNTLEKKCLFLPFYIFLTSKSVIYRVILGDHKRPCGQKFLAKFVKSCKFAHDLTNGFFEKK
jgi:hypothetical protein